jgi:hypothetical protein
MRTIFAVVLGFNIGFGVAFANEEATLKAKVEQATTAAPATVATPPATAAPAATAVTASTSGFTDTVCTSGGNTRKVELISASAETKVPCEVHYKKETEQPGHDQVIYTANNEIGFCHSKAAAFVDKLAGMGWTCTAK